MQGDDSTTARARQLLDSCSRTITVTRIQAGDGTNPFRAETSAFPELHADGAAAAAVAAASDELSDEDMRNEKCGVCMNDLIGDEHGEALAVGQCVTLRQLMCTLLQPGTGARQHVSWLTPLSHHVFHGPCIETWFNHCMQQPRPACCPACKFVFSNSESAADVTWQNDVSQAVIAKIKLENLLLDQ
jgi:hypothetical protein